MNAQLRNQAIKLRLEKELSYGEIRKRLGVPKSTLSYWLREFPLTEEKVTELLRGSWKRGEASRERFRTTMRNKRALKDYETYNKYRKRFERLSPNSFFIAGLMLYLGEGDKRTYDRINLANTDSKVINFFIKWMIEFLGIKKGKLRAQLHLHEGMDTERERKFWGGELGFSEAQFYKTQTRRPRKGSYSYKESFRHGTCGIYVSDTEKKRELMMAMRAFIDYHLEDV